MKITKTLTTILSVLILVNQMCVGLVFERSNPTAAHLASQLETTWPQNFASIRHIAPANTNNQPTVFFIQDVHMNLEAQKNISSLLSYLIKKYQVDVVGLEGTFDTVPLQSFQSFSDKETVRSVADYLLGKNEISGPIHAGLTIPPSQITFVGIDEKKAYAANVDAYKKASTQVKIQKALLADQVSAFRQKESTILNAQALSFDQRRAAYNHQEISLGQYLSFLTHQKNINSDSFLPATETYLSAATMEKNLNFAAIERERTQLITKLTQKMSEKESADFMQTAVAFRAGTMKNSTFYMKLDSVCQSKGLSIPTSSELRHYIEYLALSENIDIERLYNEISFLENNLTKNLAKSPEENLILTQSKVYLLTEKLLDFSLTKKEWQEYRSLRANNQAPALKPFENFYQQADIRDHEMANRFIETLRQKNSKVAVLITGGYHATGISEKLLGEKMTCVSVVPKITKVEALNGTSYLSIFNQEKTPLEKIFSGEKLFLAENPMKRTPEGVALDIAGLSTVAHPERTAQSIFDQLTAGLTTARGVTVTAIRNGFDFVVRAIFPSGSAIEDRGRAEKNETGLLNLIDAHIAALRPGQEPLRAQSSTVPHKNPTTKKPSNRNENKSQVMAHGKLSITSTQIEGKEKRQISISHNWIEKKVPKEGEPREDLEGDLYSEFNYDATAAANIRNKMANASTIWAEYLQFHQNNDSDYLYKRFKKNNVTFRTDFIRDPDHDFYMATNMSSIIIDDEASSLPPILLTLFLNHESNQSESLALYEDLQFYSWLVAHHNNEIQAAIHDQLEFASQPYFRFLAENINKSESIQRKAVAKFIIHETLAKLGRLPAQKNRAMTFKSARRTLLTVLAQLYPRGKTPRELTALMDEFFNAGGHFIDDPKLITTAEDAVIGFIDMYSEVFKENPERTVIPLFTILYAHMRDMVAQYQQYPALLNNPASGDTHTLRELFSTYAQFHHDNIAKEKDYVWMFHPGTVLQKQECLTMERGTLLVGIAGDDIDVVYIYLGDPWEKEETHLRRPIFYRWTPKDKKGEIETWENVARKQESHNLKFNGFIFKNPHDTTMRSPDTIPKVPTADLSEEYAKIARKIDSFIDQSEDNYNPTSPIMATLDHVVSKLSPIVGGHLHPLKKNRATSGINAGEDIINTLDSTPISLQIEPVGESCRGKDVVIIVHDVTAFAKTQKSFLNLDEANSINITLENSADQSSLLSQWPTLKHKIRFVDNNGLILNGMVRLEALSSGLPIDLRQNKNNLMLMITKQSVFDPNQLNLSPEFGAVLCVILDSLEEMDKEGVVTTLNNLKAALITARNA